MSKTVVACAENQAAFNHLSLVAARCLGGRREQYRFSVLKAMKSLKLYPLPIESIEEALALEGVGPALAKELMKAVEASKKKSNKPAQNNDIETTTGTMALNCEEQQSVQLSDESSSQLSQYSYAVEMSVPHDCIEESSARGIDISNLELNRIRKKSSALSVKRRIEETSPESSPICVRNRQNSKSTIIGQNLTKEPSFRKILLEIPDSPQVLMTASESAGIPKGTNSTGKMRSMEGEHAYDDRYYQSETDYQHRNSEQSHLKLHRSDSTEFDRKNLKKLSKNSKSKPFQNITAMKENIPSNIPNNIPNNIHVLDLTQSDPADTEHVENFNSNPTANSQSIQHFLQSSPLLIDDEHSADHFSCGENSDNEVAVFESRLVQRACRRSRYESSTPSLSQLNILDMASRQSSLNFKEHSSDNAEYPKVSLTFSQSSFEGVGDSEYECTTSYLPSSYNVAATSYARSNSTSSSTFAFSSSSAFFPQSSASSAGKSSASSSSQRQCFSSSSLASVVLHPSSSSAAVAAAVDIDSNSNSNSNVRECSASSSSSKSKILDLPIPKANSNSPLKYRAPSAKQSNSSRITDSNLRDKDELDTDCLVINSSDEEGNGVDPCDPYSEDPTVDPFLGPLIGPVTNWEPVLIVDSREKDYALVQVRPDPLCVCYMLIMRVCLCLCVCSFIWLLLCVFAYLPVSLFVCLYSELFLIPFSLN